MQRKTILVASLSLLLVGLALPAAGIPRAHAFTAGNTTVTLSNILRSFIPPSGFGTVDAAQAGQTLSVNVVVQASSFTSPAYQRNVTIGFKGDWMTQYTNASNAGPANTLPLTANQLASVTISVPLPSSGSILPAHTWTVAVWDGALNSPVGVTCPTADLEQSKACITIGNGQAGYHALAIYSSDQFSAAQASLQATAAIANVPNTFSLPAAAGQLSQANTEFSLGDQSWANGDYSGAKTHYQNALSDANAATSTFVNQGGGQTNANIAAAILASTGTILFGIGGLLAGLGGFFYLRRKPKA